MGRTKSLLIGINYTGTDNELDGCHNDVGNVKKFLAGDRGWSEDGDDMVVMLDTVENEGTTFWPNHENILKAFKWLTHNNMPGDKLWLSYSGHGGQVKDLEGERASGFDDSICPVDYEEAGQISSDTLHRVVVSPVHPGVRMHILFDCCHSGSACELPFVYRPDADGNVNLLDVVKEGMSLIRAAGDLLQGDFNSDKIEDAKMLLGGASDFLNSLKHRHHGSGDVDEDGLAPETFEEDWESEGKDVWMYSGCADDQTAADTNIAGLATGAMSWAFINTMKENPSQSYIDILRNTREALVKTYSQIPQLSCGGRYDLDQPLDILG